MKVRASVKKKVQCKIVRRKGILYVINKILDLNKDKDNYGKNSG
jgi:ribosomal protein L36